MSYITDGRCIVNLNKIVTIYTSKRSDTWKIDFYSSEPNDPDTFDYDTKEERDIAFEKITKILKAQTI